jgi:hypothetical protein
MLNLSPYFPLSEVFLVFRVPKLPKGLEDSFSFPCVLSLSASCTVGEGNSESFELIDFPPDAAESWERPKRRRRMVLAVGATSP